MSLYVYIFCFLVPINLFIKICIFLDTKDLQNNIEPKVEHGPKLGINKNTLRHMNNIIDIFRKYFSKNDLISLKNNMNYIFRTYNLQSNLHSNL